MTLQEAEEALKQKQKELEQKKAEADVTVKKINTEYEAIVKKLNEGMQQVVNEIVELQGHIKYKKLEMAKAVSDAIGKDTSRLVKSNGEKKSITANRLLKK